MNAQVFTALHLLGQANEALVIVPQIVVEFWTVATRPLANNGLGLTPEQAKTEVDRLLGTFQLFAESASIFGEWRSLAETYAVSGLKTHDARIVAAMKTHGITQILTFNAEDFQRYKEVTVLTPQSVSSRTVGGGSLT